MAGSKGILLLVVNDFGRGEGNGDSGGTQYSFCRPEASSVLTVQLDHGGL